ncbi:MAG: UDP-N-acetylmuramate dehydrogenase [Gammaproteobacteria bacterium]|nr:UDP-N-acetylmuramate dehydrogenase [Gammaproteobacteria bacterium]
MSVAIADSFQLRVRRDEPMSRHTSWRTGGPAEVFFTPHDRAELVAFLRALPLDVPLTWVGLGSNLLVRDGGIRGVVIGTQGAFTRLERLNSTRVHCDAGVPCARLARQCAAWGLGQAEFFAGIPGTFGGALAMNAGAYGGETWAVVTSVETVDRSGRVQRRDRTAFKVGYRHVEVPAPDEWFLAAELRFGARQPGEEQRVRELSERRRQTQPLGVWSCGSVFTNPPGDHAGRLIEAAGLKGCRRGGAVVSAKHANFIINEGSASARDIETLIRHVQATVQRVHGVSLVPEVRIVGEDLHAAQD